MAHIPTIFSNPILPGFNPDPSICRVDADYFIATSTFEWYPGVQIHHSRDLVNWRLVKRPLDRASQLDHTGILSDSVMVKLAFLLDIPVKQEWYDRILAKLEELFEKVEA